jgi:DNA repair protein RadC
MKTKNIIELEGVKYSVGEVEVTYKTKTKPYLKVSSSKDTFNILERLWSDKIEYQEEFCILCLNRANNVVSFTKVSMGGVNQITTDLKMILQICLASNASGLILSHNHPSGNMKPSQEDVNLTKKAEEACKLFDITMLDHIIMSKDSYFSFADEGLINW